MPDRLDLLECRQFLPEAIPIRHDELDGLEQTPRRFTFPDFPKTAASEWHKQAIAGERLGARLPVDGLRLRSRKGHDRGHLAGQCGNGRSVA